MRYLIVNGDDFGISPGVNRGIAQAHRRGILTSTSLLVDLPASVEAADVAHAYPSLSFGLHADLDVGGIDRNDTESCRRELHRQLARFVALMGRGPTHLDSHHNAHRDPRLLPVFLEVAHDAGLPLREHSPARYFSKFYGYWGGETHPDQVGAPSLIRMLRDEIGDGITEMGCHPGYVDAGLVSGYRSEREVELETLCSPTLREAVEQGGIQLVDFGAMPALAAGMASMEGHG